jgi:anti-sigma regulatory factor (Ser/Thr protein kinase)
MQVGGCELLHELAFEARASALTEMRRQVTEILTLANCSVAEVQSIVIALNEACMNIIQHAYHGDSCKPIRLHIEANDEDVHFELLDCAAPIDLSRVRGRSLEDLRPGGLGVNFIAQLMHEVHYSHRTEDAGNCLRMTWKRRPRASH